MKFNYEPEIIKSKIKKAIGHLIKHDKYLLELGVHESAISHKLAIYLEKEFKDLDLDIDCEWNKNLNDTKYILFDEILNNIETSKLKFKNDECPYKKRLNNVETLIKNKVKFNLSPNHDSRHNNEETLFRHVDEKGHSLYYKKFRPDIIIHKRGTNDKNLVAIEIKKANSERLKYYEKLKDFDLMKLHFLTTNKDFHYEFGVYVELGENFSELKSDDIKIEKSMFIKKVFRKKCPKTFEGKNLKVYEINIK